MEVTCISKRAEAGDLRTPVYFKRIQRVTDAEGFSQEVEVNVLGQNAEGEDIPFRVKWANAHGYDVFTSIQLKLNEPATITMRYHPDIDTDLIVYKGSDPKPYEIISIDDVEERHRWLEAKVQRKVEAR